jgi:hypothetical protein
LIVTLFFLSLILSFLHLLACIYIVWATSLVLCPYPSPTPRLPGRTCSAHLLTEFIEEIIRKTAFLLVWSKDSYTKRFLALLSCTCVLQPTLFHLSQTSLVLPGPLPIRAFTSLKLLYWLLYSEHINHIQVLDFLSLSYPSCACSPLSVWPMSNNITVFVLSNTLLPSLHSHQQCMKVLFSLDPHNICCWWYFWC